tara:strand:- start:567 stop:752 length:186 start_codon:yes stop_codon:yes gene_type:complete
MATSIEDLYKASEFSKIKSSSEKDKTPVSLDGGKDLMKPANLEKARGAKLNLKKYSDSVQR